MRRFPSLLASLVLGVALAQPASGAVAPRALPVPDGAPFGIGLSLRGLFGPPTPLLPATLDADDDGWVDPVEVALGSDPSGAAETPESLAIPESCMNGADDDLDGAIDERDDGCQPPPLARKTFPAAGADAFDSTISLDGYVLPTPLGDCPLDLEAGGPVVVRRDDPVDLGGGLRTIATEMIAMQLSGVGMLLPGSPCNPGTSPTSFPATVVEDPAHASTGGVTDTNDDPTFDFPADSFFDVFFLIDTPFGVLPGGPPGGAPGTPVSVTNTIRSVPPYHSPGNPKLNPSCYTVAGLPHQHCPKPPLDHFKCYTGSFPAFEGKATLEDQFGRERVRLGTANRFCNPVSKNGQGIFDDGGHLVRYGVSPPAGAPPFAPIDVLVQNQFGLQPMMVVGRSGLFVPSRKDDLAPPAALDHFKCYAVRGGSVDVRVRLEDQFDVADGRVERARVLTPVTLCNPVEKTHGGTTTPIGDATMHLVCYTIETKAFQSRTVLVRNQLGKGRVKVRRPVELCVPSLKMEVPPIEVDEFPSIVAQVEIQTETGSEVVHFVGSATVNVHMDGLADTDGDGLEQVTTEIVQMDLTGTSQLLGPLMIRLPSGTNPPGPASAGEIEESENTHPGVLDLPPFTSTGTAESFFDVFFELEKVVGGVTVVLHNEQPKQLTALITYKPCGPGDIYQGSGIVPLLDVNQQPVPIHVGLVTIGPNLG